MMWIDLVVMALVLTLLQVPLMYIAYVKDLEIRRLQKALLKVEKPTIAAVVDPPVKEPVQLTEEERIQRRARSNMFKP